MIFWRLPSPDPAKEAALAAKDAELAAKAARIAELETLNSDAAVTMTDAASLIRSLKASQAALQIEWHRLVRENAELQRAERERRSLWFAWLPADIDADRKYGVIQ
jgi:hypothetical protein